MSRLAENLPTGPFVVLPRRGLCREDAATYIGVGVSKFDEMVKDKRMPRPKRIDKRTVWDIKQLDNYFEMLPTDGQATEDNDDVYSDLSV